jgi:hypothetical protein
MPVIDFTVYFVAGSLLIAFVLFIMFASVYSMEYFVNGDGNKLVAWLVAFVWFAVFATILGYLVNGNKVGP